MKHFDIYDEVSNLEECRKTTTCHAKKMDEPFVVETLEGTMRGNAGDYLMKGADGELYPCKAEIFEKTYEFIETLED